VSIKFAHLVLVSRSLLPETSGTKDETLSSHVHSSLEKTDKITKPTQTNEITMMRLSNHKQ
jgi:hypothetical protein